jgi:hypothetical protein
VSALHYGLALTHTIAGSLLGTGLLAELGRWCQHTRWWLQAHRP